MKILFITNIPSPYRVVFFNELGKKCELTVLYQKNSSSERDKKWVANTNNSYKSVVLKGIRTGVDNAFCPQIIKYLNDKSFDRIVICGIASPTEMLAIEWCKLCHKHYFLESDGGFSKTGKGLKERIKKHLVKNADGYFSTGIEHDNYYLTYGADEKKIKRYPFTSLKYEEILERPISKIEKKQIRNKLGIKEERVVLAVGQFIYRKGFDILLNIANQLDAGIYIVGGVPTEEYKAFKCENVHFKGFMTKNELKEYYYAADVFVHPTREDIWGLVINEAMACGLPVVTTDKCIAGLEMIKSGVNGYIVPVENSLKLKEAINKAFEINNPEGSLLVAKKFTIEKMVDRHLEIL